MVTTEYGKGTMVRVDGRNRSSPETEGQQRIEVRGMRFS